MSPPTRVQRDPATPAAQTTDDGREFLQRRIAFFGKAGALLVLGNYLLVHAARALAPDGSWDRFLDADGVLHLTSAALLGAVWLAARAPARTTPVLRALDAAGSVLACLSASLPVLLPEATDAYKWRMLLVITNALIARAAVVPTPAGWTLRLSAAAALPAVALAYLYHASRGSADAAFQAVVALLWAATAVAIATVTSRTIYGLRQEVRAARQLGQYTLLDKIGEGGMGEVYRARHAMLRRETAVKLLPPGRGGETALARFEREVQLTAILTHPNTVSVFDYGRTSDGVFYYAMEYLEGLNLDQLVSAHGAQPPARVAHVLRQVLGALSEAHGIGLIHRDVKPANIILCQRGGQSDVAKVFDFGLVRAAGDPGDASLTGANVITGTPLFLSPEAITSPEAVDARSDLYAVGGVAYYLLTGRYVFDGKTVVEVCGHQLHTAPTPPSERLGRPLPAGLEALTLACLEKDPARRPASAAELLARLDASDLPAWTEDDARAWWAEHAPVIDVARSQPTPWENSTALTVDMGDRG
jgi:eukaryotic-like serine/threonine-protein kinase